MLKTYYLASADFLTEPWKNGRGESRVIAQDQQRPFRWRLSLSSLTSSGPFSAYPGYDRKTLFLSSAPVAMSQDGNVFRNIPPLTIYPFKGEKPTEAKVQSPVEDFNTFALREKCKLGLYLSHVKHGEDVQFPVPGQEHFFILYRRRVGTA